LVHIIGSVLRRRRLSGESLYSQGNEELLIRDFFSDRREGFFVDIGAGHWRNDSNTLFLEERLGWSGIAVDALAGEAQDYRAHRPRTAFFNYIVTDHSGTRDPLFQAGCLSSTRRDHRERFSNLRHAEIPIVSVPTITLDELLDDAGVDCVDLLCMDIEQGEPAALAGFDIGRFRPELVCVEAGSSLVRRWVEPYFAAHAYHRIDEYLAYDWVNWYYVPAGA
jgi:FkbM family methyltransferase